MQSASNGAHVYSNKPLSASAPVKANAGNTQAGTVKPLNYVDYWKPAQQTTGTPSDEVISFFDVRQKENMDAIDKREHEAQSQNIEPRRPIEVPPLPLEDALGCYIPQDVADISPDYSDSSDGEEIAIHKAEFIENLPSQFILDEDLSFQIVEAQAERKWRTENDSRDELQRPPSPSFQSLIASETGSMYVDTDHDSSIPIPQPQPLAAFTSPEIEMPHESISRSQEIEEEFQEEDKLQFFGSDDGFCTRMSKVIVFVIALPVFCIVGCGGYIIKKARTDLGISKGTRFPDPEFGPPPVTPSQPPLVIPHSSHPSAPRALEPQKYPISPLGPLTSPLKTSPSRAPPGARAPISPAPRPAVEGGFVPASHHPALPPQRVTPGRAAFTPSTHNMRTPQLQMTPIQSQQPMRAGLPPQPLDFSHTSPHRSVPPQQRSTVQGGGFVPAANRKY